MVVMGLVSSSRRRGRIGRRGSSGDGINGGGQGGNYLASLLLSGPCILAVNALPTYLLPLLLLT